MAELAPNLSAREQFELSNPLDSAEKRETAANSTQLFKDSMDVLRENQRDDINRGQHISKSAAGSEAGKCLVKYLSSRQDSPTVLKPVKAYIEKFLSPQKTGEFMSGFVGEYAFAHFLATARDHSIEYPETKEDTELKVDWVIKDQNKPDTYVQTKVLPFASEQIESTRMVYDISQPAALKEMADNLYSYRYKKDLAIGDYVKRAEEMLKINQEGGKQLIFCLIPSDEISIASGTFVNFDFKDQLSSQLESVGL